MATLPRPRRSTWILFAGILLLAGLYATWVWTDALTDLGGDSGAYLIISRLYSPWHAPSAATLAYKNVIVSPPLFPLMLSLVDGGYHLLAAHLLVAACAIASVTAMYFWLKREAFHGWVAAIMALVFALLPITLMTMFNIWSEFPYLFFSMAAIASLATSDGEPTQRGWFAAAAMAACASLIRVAALPLLAAFLLYLLLRRPKNWIVLGIAAALPFATWALYSSLRETGAGSYVNHFTDVYAGDPIGKLIRQCSMEYDAVFKSWKTGWLQFSSSTELHGIVTGFWYLCIAGWLYRLVRLKFDAIYCLLYLIELFLWPHPEEAARYSFVLYPVFIGSGFLLASAVPKRIAEPNGRPYLAGLGAVVMLLAMLPAFAYDLDLFNAEVPVEIAETRHTQEWYTLHHYYAKVNGYFEHKLFAHLKSIAGEVASNDCIYATKPTLVTLFADRVAMVPPNAAASDTQFNAGIAACRYAYVTTIISPSFPEAFYPQHRLGERAHIVSEVGDSSGNRYGVLLEIKP